MLVREFNWFFVVWSVLESILVSKRRQAVGIADDNNSGQRHRRCLLDSQLIIIGASTDTYVVMARSCGW